MVLVPPTLLALLILVFWTILFLQNRRDLHRDSFIGLAQKRDMVKQKLYKCLLFTLFLM
jgi:hypothetical protein